MQEGEADNFDSAHRAYAERRLLSFRAQFDMARFLTNCSMMGLEICYRNAVELERLSQFIVDKVRTRDPFSLLRVGDGEGNLLSLSLPGSVSARDMRWVNAIFQVEDGRTVGTEEAKSLSAEMFKSIRDADVIGTRLFRPFDEFGTWSELESATTALANGKVRGCVGMIDAVEALENLLAGTPRGVRMLTSAWIYLHLLSDLSRFLEHAERIVVISGRPALKEIFEAKCRGKRLHFIEIPVEAIGGRKPGHATQYPDHYNRIITFLRQEKEIRGSLVLVGAGLFGKIYCGVAKASGAGALDMGSAFDLMVGLKTRPIHTKLLREMRERAAGADTSSSLR